MKKQKIKFNYNQSKRREYELLKGYPPSGPLEIKAFDLTPPVDMNLDDDEFGVYSVKTGDGDSFVEYGVATVALR